MKHLLTVMLALMLILCAGCRTSSIAQAHGPLVTPAQVSAALAEHLAVVVTKDTDEFTAADVELLRTIHHAVGAYEHWVEFELLADDPPFGGPAPPAGGESPSDSMLAPEDVWSREEIQDFGEWQYRLDTGDPPLPTSEQQQELREFNEYLQRYEEWLLSLGGGTPVDDGGDVTPDDDLTSPIGSLKGGA